MDVLDLLATPFLAALMLVAIHAYFGVHVLERKIVFVDLALAQIAALGATLAFMLGYPPQSLAAYAYSLLFTLAGSLLLSFTRLWTNHRLSQETLVGVIYVMAAAGAVLLVDQAPQGAEHLKQILTGNILTVNGRTLLGLGLLYGTVAALHWLLHKRFMRISVAAAETGLSRRVLWWWDWLFYASFGMVVTSSVAVAGVLLVFSFLIIPAAIGMLYSKRLSLILAIGWGCGAIASGGGMLASYAWNLPTGAAMVCGFGVLLLLAALAKPLLTARMGQKNQVLRKFVRVGGRSAVIVVLLSATWLVLRPQADQPLFDVVETLLPGLRQPFLTPAERELLAQSTAGQAQARQQADRLIMQERDSRWQGQAMSDEEVRRLSSFTQSYMEMSKGEAVVQREMRDRARSRQRWVLGIPLILFCIAAWLWSPPRDKYLQKLPLPLPI